ncbi:peptidase M28 family protein, partial [Mucilaginibacter sp. 5B2]|nr:peptidase M28 family protein [Mucilaginibacter sp. 5B2]
MKKALLLSIVLLVTTLASQAQDSLQIRKFYDEALVNGQCYENLRYLCKKIGQRLSGSAGAAKSVE